MGTIGNACDGKEGEPCDIDGDAFLLEGWTNGSLP